MQPTHVYGQGAWAYEGRPRLWALPPHVLLGLMRCDSVCTPLWKGNIKQHPSLSPAQDSNYSAHTRMYASVYAQQFKSWPSRAGHGRPLHDPSLQIPLLSELDLSYPRIQETKGDFGMWLKTPDHDNPRPGLSSGLHCQNISLFHFIPINAGYVRKNSTDRCLHILRVLHVL